MRERVGNEIIGAGDEAGGALTMPPDARPYWAEKFVLALSYSFSSPTAMVRSTPCGTSTGTCTVRGTPESVTALKPLSARQGIEIQLPPVRVYAAIEVS